jgi:hypothetical protein
MQELTEEHKQSRLLLEAVSQVESAVQETPLSARILAFMKN